MSLLRVHAEFPETSEALHALSSGWHLTTQTTRFRAPMDPGYWFASYPDDETRLLEVRWDDGHLEARRIEADYVGPWFRPALNYVTNWRRVIEPKAKR